MLLSGLPGSGKSHLARMLAERLDVTVVSSDRVRRLLIARPTYVPAEHELIHTVCARLVERGLREGRAVVLDATNLRVLGRRRYRDLARASGALCCAALLTCPEETARVRLRRRVASPVTDASEADERIYELLRAGQEIAGDFDLHLRGDADALTNVAAVALRLLPGAAAQAVTATAVGAPS